MAVNNVSVADSQRTLIAQDGTGSPQTYTFVNLVPESLSFPHLLPQAQSLVARQTGGSYGLYSAASHGQQEGAEMTFQIYEADLGNTTDSNGVNVVEKSLLNADPSGWTSAVSTNPLADTQRKMIDWKESIALGNGSTKTATAAGYVTAVERTMVNGRVARSVTVMLVENATIA